MLRDAARRRPPRLVVTPRPAGAHAVRLGVLLTAVVGVGALSIDMFLPSLPTMTAVFGSDAMTAQLTVTLFLAGFAVAQLIFGPLSDRLGRRRVLIGGLALYTVAGLGCAAAPSMGLLVLARVVQALGAGSGPVVARAIVRDLYEQQRAARMLAAMGTAQAVTPILAPIIGGWVHVLAGWRAVFFVLTGFGVLFSLGALVVVPETNVHVGADRRRADDGQSRLLTLATDRTFVAYVLVLALSFSGQFAFIAGSSFALITVLGVSPTVYGFCFGSVALGLMVGNFVSVHLTARVGIDGMIRGGTALAAVAATLMAGLAWLGVATVPTVIVPMFAVAAGLGLVMPNAMAGAIGPFPRMAGLASAVLGFVQMTGSALYAIAVGHLYDGTLRPMTTAVATATLASLAAFRLLNRRRPPR
jgi:MFS transporter, DHA1 family, multidrug resistance protein